MPPYNLVPKALGLGQDPMGWAGQDLYDVTTSDQETFLPQYSQPMRGRHYCLCLNYGCIFSFKLTELQLKPSFT